MKTDYKINLVYLFAISLVSALGGLLFGYDLVVIGGAKVFYQLTYNLSSPAIQGWAVSSCIVGCIIGAMSVGKPADKYGRKKLLIISGVFFFISALGSGYAPTFTQFVMYRLLGGIGMGMASTLSPMYIAEISPAKLRGRFVSLNQLTIVLGILLAQFINYAILQSHPISPEIEGSRPLALAIQGKVAKIDDKFKVILVSKDDAEEVKKDNEIRVSKEQLEKITAGKFLTGLPREIANSATIVSAMTLGTITRDDLKIDAICDFYDQQLHSSWNGQTGWRWMFAAEGIPALLFFGFMFFVPFSPRWLAKVGRTAEAEVILAKIGGDEHAKIELAEIASTLDDNQEECRWGELLHSKYFKILTMGIILAVYQQWCGINVIFNYANDIFKEAGYSVSGILFNLLIVGLTNLIFTFVAMGLIDKIGRKILILWGSLGLAACYTGVGLCFHFHITGVGVLILVLGAIACFAATLGPVMWVLISEIFPNRIRGMAMAISVLSLWVANFILSYTFPILNNSLGASYTFWLYAVINVLGFFFILKRIPETKGKSLEEIEEELQK